MILRITKLLISLLLLNVFLPAQVDASNTSLTYVIDRNTSIVQVFVYRGGLLKSFGHDHLISTNIIEGELIFSPQQFTDAHFSFTLPVTAFSVDDPEQRKSAGSRFTKSVPEVDRNATRTNMLGNKVLDAEHFPDIVLSGNWTGESLEQGTVHIGIRLRNLEKELILPVNVERQGTALFLKGQFEFLQSNLGITPFSALGGMLKVADKLEIFYSLTLRPL